ncbi:MAG TPA: protein-export chaperone SecB [Steroidobacteraceae bacterium]|jgi:preprotein translocase subunit SecB|nr:protein-export chaperone SecB [Steroidobacteraceae bacterium]
MANETAGAVPVPAMADETGVVLALQNVYLKDCSYESPNGPRLDGTWNPQINLDLQTGSTALGPDVREVVLTVTASAKLGEVTIFLVEVKQAGLFVIRNLGEADLKRAINTVCAGTLFPYARCAISQLVSQGGFPQFLLPPVNFEALYANQTEQPAVTN